MQTTTRAHAMRSTYRCCLSTLALLLESEQNLLHSQQMIGWHGPYLSLPPEISADIICDGKLLCKLSASSFQLSTKLVDSCSSVCSLLM